jgi:pilus assembly protein Flp/PilA
MRSLSLLQIFARDERGVTAVEYSLLACLIFLTILGGVTLAGPEVEGIFAYIGSAIAGASSSIP